MEHQIPFFVRYGSNYVAEKNSPSSCRGRPNSSCPDCEYLLLLEEHNLHSEAGVGGFNSNQHQQLSWTFDFDVRL